MMAFTVELSMVLVLIPRIIFSFCEMDFIDYLVTYGVFTNIFGKKIEPLVVFMKLNKKN